MEPLRRRPVAPAAVAVLVLAVAGALALLGGDAVSSANADAETLPVVAWLVGWALLVWAAVLGGFVLLHQLGRGAPGHRSPRPGTVRS